MPRPMKRRQIADAHDPPPKRGDRRHKKLKAHQSGRRAEALAILWLGLKGYRILGRNLRLPQGEIDVVARRGTVLVFVEVKYRAHIALAQDAVSARQWQRIARAAEKFVGARPGLQGLRWRFDVMAMAPYRWPQHRQNMWRA